MPTEPARPPRINRVVVVIPAHDERERIAAAVESVIAAAVEAGRQTVVRVVLDACTDGTGAVVPAGAGGVGVEKRIVTARNVGAARAAGVDPVDLRSDVWLAHTDADTIVDRRWLATQIAHAEAGAGAVVGTIGVGDWEERPGDVRPRYELLYDDAPGHRHIHGANLGVRGSAYGWVGGFRSLDESEDVDLVERLTRADVAVAWVDDCRVTTSARVSKRTGGGFSGFLDELQRGTGPSAGAGVGEGVGPSVSGGGSRAGSVPAGEQPLEAHGTA